MHARDNQPETRVTVLSVGEPAGALDGDEGRTGCLWLRLCVVL